MKISTINNVFNNQKYTNFNGLWGKTSLCSDFNKGINIPIITTTYYYFPYKNETEEKVQSIIRKNISAGTIRINGQDQLIDKKCKKGVTLPFTEEEYNTYRNLSEDDFKDTTPKSYINQWAKFVHDWVSDKYTNKDGQQITAKNETISQLISCKRIQ